MKTIIKLFLIILISAIVIYGIIYDIKKVQNKNNEVYEEEVYVDKTTVTYNGWLKTKGSNLLNSKNEVVMLKGISTHGIQWYNNLYTYDNLKYLKEEWKINTFRIAMYTSPKSDGYIKNPNIKYDVFNLIDYCIDLDMYVIVDWHILKDSNPKTYEKESIEFFDEISKRYRNVENVIYEVCNEPNGNTKWEDVKSYSEKVIDVIRDNSPKSLIIVGMTDWCRDLDSSYNNPIERNNIMYSLHFYSGTDNSILRKKLSRYINKGMPIFISECGITNSTGTGKIYKEEFKRWLTFLKENNMSWIFWSFSNKDETSSILTKEYKQNTTTNMYIDDYLSETGKIIKEFMRNY